MVTQSIRIQVSVSEQWKIQDAIARAHESVGTLRADRAAAQLAAQEHIEAFNEIVAERLLAEDENGNAD